MNSFKLIIVIIIATLLVISCSKNDNTPASGFKGTLYYSNYSDLTNTIFKMDLSTQTETKLFTNAEMPEITASGQILCVEPLPTRRIIFTDLKGANRQTLISYEGSNSPAFKYYMENPRISYNQKYVAYDGDYINNPVTYVIDATSGALISTIGDYNAKYPMTNPSWGPDGSLYVQGWTSMDNGIYKIPSDFSTIKRIDPNLSNVKYPSASPDGKYIAFIRDGQLWLMGVDGSNPTQLYSDIFNLSMPTWSADSKYIAVSSSTQIYIVDLNKLTATVLKKGYASDNNQMTWKF